VDAQPPAPGVSPLAGILQGTLDCVHCGMCLPACPTYRETGRETSSPRGRIYLMRAVAEGRLPLGDALAEEAYLCLGCRACETACPSGVRFGSLLEHTRGSVERAGLRQGFAKRAERFALRHVVPRPALLRALMDLLAIAQRLGRGSLRARRAARSPSSRPPSRRGGVAWPSSRAASCPSSSGR